MTAIEAAVSESPAEFRDYKLYHYAINKVAKVLGIYDSPFNAMNELGVGWYSFLSYDDYSVKKLFEMRPKGVKLEDVFPDAFVTGA